MKMGFSNPSLRLGSRPELPAIVVDSNVYTVVGGGRFDGIVGVIAGLEVAHVLHERGVGLRHQLRVIDLTSEVPSDYGASCLVSRTPSHARNDTRLDPLRTKKGRPRMDLGLTGKRALVLAASSGLGFATAKCLAAEGARVALCSRYVARAQSAAQRIEDETGNAVTAFGADVSRSEDLERLVEESVAELGGLDILVCNAGGPPPGSFSKVSEEQWDAAYQLTLQSVVRSVRFALPHLQSDGGGSVLVLASSSVKQPIPNLLLSNVFRPAVQALCKHLASEVATSNVRVNCLSPGRIHTDRIDQLDKALAEREGKSLEQVRAESVASIPLGRLGEPDEFGRVAAFLCSDSASYMTGTSVLVDGGVVKSL